MKALKHIAGVGSSPVVQYEGTGIYFIDKVADNEWKLEVYPDIMNVDDPFQGRKREPGCPSGRLSQS